MKKKILRLRAGLEPKRSETVKVVIIFLYDILLKLIFSVSSLPVKR